MLRMKMERFLGEKAQWFKEEKEYATRTGLLDDGAGIVEENNRNRFNDAYIEVGDKETESLIAIKETDFLKSPISYFKEHKNEFVYLESKWWDMVSVDAVCLENDDVFKKYDVLLGLKLQKKYGPEIKSYLAEHLQGEQPEFDLLFDSNEGIWSLNFSLNDVEGFDDAMSIGEAYLLIYGFLFGLAEAVENHS